MSHDSGKESETGKQAPVDLQETEGLPTQAGTQGGCVGSPGLLPCAPVPARNPAAMHGGDARAGDDCLERLPAQNTSRDCPDPVPVPIPITCNECPGSH